MLEGVGVVFWLQAACARGEGAGVVFWLQAACARGEGVGVVFWLQAVCARGSAKGILYWDLGWRCGGYEQFWFPKLELMGGGMYTSQVIMTVREGALYNWSIVALHLDC